jgi:hypothetical protein
MQTLEGLAELVMPLPLGLNLWKVQNTWWELRKRVLPEFAARARAGDAAAEKWLAQFQALGVQLGFAVKSLNAETVSLKLAA